MTRVEIELLPEFTAELQEIRENGINTTLLGDIIQKHLSNSNYNRALYKRYMAIHSGVPIFDRKPRYKEEENPINNKINNDFFSQIVNAKVGCFAGNPISYSYSDTDEAEEETGGKGAVDVASQTLTDFIVRNNMFGVDMETTKYASIYGYSGRLLYIDREGHERVMPVHGYETIILSDTDISEPEFAIRYYKSLDKHNAETWTVEFYDSKNITIFKGSTLLDLVEVEVKEHLFDYCPLQGIANNKECMGDAEKVLALIDAYDKIVSDNSNELEAFAHAMLLVNLNVQDGVIEKAQKSGTLVIPPVGTNHNNEPVKWLTKNINDAFCEHQLDRIEDNIYAFSQTPNFNDESFGSASGVSLEHKFNGMREKCTTFKASVLNSAHHFWKTLCSSWAKKGISINPLHIVMDFKFNIPQDTETEARTVQTLIGAGLPKRYAFAKLSDVDDVEWIMDEIETEKEDAMSLYEAANKSNNDNDNNDDNDNANNGTNDTEEE